MSVIESSSSEKPLVSVPEPRDQSAPALKPTHKSVSTKSHLAAGFVSGLTSSVLLQPLDLLKTRVQQQKHLSQTISSTKGIVGSTKSLRQALKEIPSVGALWRGTSASAIRTSVGSALYLTMLNATRTYLSRSYLTSTKGSASTSSSLPKLPMYANLASGAVVRGIVGFITMPVTVVKVRYESSLFHYTSLSHAVSDIYASHGVAGFFKGWGVTFLRDAPNAGLYVLFYEMWKDVLSRSASLIGVDATQIPTSQLAANTKDSVSKLEPTNKGPSTGGSALFNSSTSALINSCSAVLSAGMATTLTGPFDTIKTRVQLDPIRYPTVWSAVTGIVREEGFKGLFDGLSLRLSRKAMAAGISWCIYEELVKKM